jgi:tRNA A-37 threonylcarbamoyl transferase component Bud32
MPELLLRLQSALAGRYRIDAEIGAGGMATVYLAQDLRHDRRVALKLLRPELSAIIGAERFLAEIKLTANLQHPHILPLFDSGEAEGFLYYVMPYIEGESLRDRLVREKQLPIDEAVRLTREVASALDYAHRHNVVHRDIKPENILLHDGSALVADFGIALAASRAGGARMTETGMSLGTPHYMSPEQAMGEREITARSDVYALGCVLYEMLTGEPPFTGPTAQAIVAKVITEKPASLIPRRETVPPEVEDAVMTALAKLPADRFHSVADFASALAPGGRTVPLRRPAARLGHPRWPWQAFLAGAAAAGVVAGLLWWRSGRGLRPADSEQRAQHTFTGRAGTPALSSDGSFLAYVERTCRHGELLCRHSLLVQEIGTNRPVTVLADVPRLTSVRWTHDGTSLVLSGDLGDAGVGLFALPRLGGTPRRVGDEGLFDTDLRADSVIVADWRATPTVVRVIALATGATTDSLVLPKVHDLRGIAWSPTGDRIALTTVSVLWLADRQKRSLLDSLALPGRGPVRWTTRGDALLTFMGVRAREDHLLRVPAGRHLGAYTIALPRVPTLYAGRFDVARRTGRLALATGDAIQDLWAFELGGGRVTGRQMTRGTTWYGSPTLDSAGGTAYYLRGDALGDNVYRLRLADSAEEALTAERQAGVFAATLTPGDGSLVYGDFPESGIQPELALLDLRSRRLRRVQAADGYNGWVLPGGQLILKSTIGWFSADSFGAVPRVAPLPDTLALLNVAIGADRQRFAALRQTGDSTAIDLIELSPLRMSRLATLGEPDVAGLSWIGSDIYVGRWRAIDSLPSIWRVPVGGGPLTRVATISAPCRPAAIMVADHGHKAICMVQEFRSDIWTVEGVGN